MLERFDLTDAAERRTKTFSGGMQRRLDLAASLVGNPSVLFLDEPTTGLDPRGRMETWELIRNLVAEGTTLLLTTQYLDEADDEESVQSFGLVWLFPLTFVSSAFVPVQTMPGWLQAFTKNQPATHVIDALRTLALGHSPL